MAVKIIKVSDRSGMNQFIHFPRELYRKDANFVFEPVAMQKDYLSRKNPFFYHSSADYFLAISGNRVVGRIACINNTVHNKVYNEQTGFFGFFESVGNYDVAACLLDKAVEWSRDHGHNRIIGPTNFTTNDTCGMLISGFDQPAVIMMPYNKPYYDEYLCRYGFVKEMDLSSYYISSEELKAAPVSKLAFRLNEKLTASGISIRKIDYKILDKEIIPFREVYNQSNLHNWGFIPLDEDEFRHIAYQFRQFVPEKLILIVEKDGRQIGFLVALPDLNQVFRHMKSGKFFPSGFLQFLWYRRKITNSRVLILGILPEYRNYGIDIMLYMQIRKNLAEVGIHHGEACYVMENNKVMNSIMHKIGGECVKKYRIYKLDLSGA